MNKGRGILAILKQLQYSPVTLAEEVLLLFGLEKEYLLKLSEDELGKFRTGIYEFAKQNAGSVLDDIEENKVMSPAVESGLRKIMEAYFESVGKGEA